jgi:hypothetical protein
LILIDGAPAQSLEHRRLIEIAQPARRRDPHIGESLIYMAILKSISETQPCACNFVIAAI